MRAGFSFMQGLEAVAGEAADPMGRELQRAFSEARVGRDIDVALEECSQRMDSADAHQDRHVDRFPFLQLEHERAELRAVRLCRVAEAPIDETERARRDEENADDSCDTHARPSLRLTATPSVRSRT